MTTYTVWIPKLGKRVSGQIQKQKSALHSLLESCIKEKVTEAKLGNLSDICDCILIQESMSNVSIKQERSKAESLV